MCGIAGFAGAAFEAAHADHRLRAMCNAIVHRGPDSDGYFVADGVAMGMRRLSIIDVAGGRQPISNEDGTVTVVFNGEIYNHHHLRKELESSGHRFLTRSDTEVLVHLYEEHGTEMVRRLHGMFAFSIWDARAQLLFVARDRTGMKPLAYRAQGGGIVFCSELRSLYAFDRSSLHVDSGAVMEYLAFGYVPAPRTIFSDVKKLAPGHYLVWKPGQDIEIRRYWSPPVPDRSIENEQELVEQIQQKLEAAVVSHLESDVPLGAFLSGGLDSSTVVALMCRHASGRVKTFSIGFSEKEYDESAAARDVARHFGTEHVDLEVRPDVEQIFETIAAMFDEPFADSSAIAAFLVAQLARESVAVALSGDGGDELFGGYTRYSEILKRGGGQRGIGSRLTGAVALMLPHSFRGRNRLVDIGRSKVGRYATAVVQPVRVDEGGIASSLHPLGLLTVDEQLQRHFPVDSDDDFAAAMMRVDVETYLPGDILTKVDRTSMAVSLEARVPLLDYDLVDLALRIPGEFRVTADESKRLFRRAIKGIVPDFVLSRPKRGFEVPLARWFRGPLKHRIEALRVPSIAMEPYVDGDAVKRLVAEHSIGRRDHSTLLWRLMVLDHWLASYRDGRLGQPPAVPRVSLNFDREAVSTDPVHRQQAPPPISDPFLRSDARQPKLRLGILVDEHGIPSYARGIIADVLAADYLRVVQVAVARQPSGGTHSKFGEGMAFRVYTSYVESRYQPEPDPLQQTGYADLVGSIPRLFIKHEDLGNQWEVDEEGIAALRAAQLDVLLDFGHRAARGAASSVATYGVWRFHFGDRRHYPQGSDFLCEIIDRSPLSGIELIRLGHTQAGDATLLRALFSTAPFPSRLANRFAPIWGARHFVVQNLWELHRNRSQAIEMPKQESSSSDEVSKAPGTARLVRWMAGKALRRMRPFRTQGNHPVRWSIAVRRTNLPLLEDASRRALESFHWLESGPGRFWADPVIFQYSGETWLFFEELLEPAAVGHISCGRLLPDCTLVDVRPVLRRAHHLSYPQIIESDGHIFMLPEGAQSGGVDLYRARRFPDDWVLESRLLDFRCVDSSVFRAQDYWWMVTSPQVIPGHAAITWLLRADKITGPWRFEPGGIVAHDATVARGGGAVFQSRGRLIRPSQDCSTAYGSALLFNEILSLTETSYRERTIRRVNAGWLPRLTAVHSYSTVGEWEAIDGGFRF